MKTKNTRWTFTQQIATFPDFWKSKNLHKIADFCPSSFIVSSLFLSAQIIMQILWWLKIQPEKQNN